MPNKKKLNEIKEAEDYFILYTSNGDEILIDTDDYEIVKDYTWWIGAKGYAVTDVRQGDRYKRILMHRLIMEPRANMEIDHINHNKIDNRRSNLRECTTKENVRYARTRSDNISGVTGVGFTKRENRWRARIFVDGKEKGLGYYKNKEDAIKARLKAEKKYFGEYAYQANVMGGRLY